MPDAPVSILPTVSGGGSPSSPVVILGAVTGGGSPSSPVVILGAVTGGGSPSSPEVILGEVTGGGSPTSPEVILAGVDGGSAPSSPVAVLGATILTRYVELQLTGSPSGGAGVMVILETGPWPNGTYNTGETLDVEEGSAPEVWGLDVVAYLQTVFALEDVSIELTGTVIRIWPVPTDEGFSATIQVSNGAGTTGITTTTATISAGVEAPAAVLGTASGGGAPLRPVPILGAPEAALLNSDNAPLSNTDGEPLQNTNP